MQSCRYGLALLWCWAAALAAPGELDPAVTPAPPLREDLPAWRPPPPAEAAPIAAPVALPAAVPASRPLPQQLDEADLVANRDLTESLLNQALLRRQWALLGDLLPLYRQIDGHDVTLYQYARGAWLRQQGRHREAIADYAAIVARHPQLPYVRLDYMAMLFENKQYRQAQRQAALLAQAGLAPAAKALVARYEAAAVQQQGWRVDGGLNYEQTDNVNNAGSERVMVLGGREFVRDDDSLPQSAHGLRYALAAERLVNVGGNHFLGGGVRGEGVFYWDARAFNEESLRVQAAYRHQTWRHNASVQPYAVHNRLGGASYSRQYGVNGSYSRSLSPRWQATLFGGVSWRRYAAARTAAAHDGRVYQAGATLAWQPRRELMLYGGADWADDRSRDPGEASQRHGWRLGGAYVWRQALGLRLDARAGARRFQERHFFFRQRRSDREYQLQAALWLPRLQWRGITPQLNYRRLHIDSNLPALYRRRSQQWFVTLEKRF